MSKVEKESNSKKKAKLRSIDKYFWLPVTVLLVISFSVSTFARFFDGRYIVTLFYLFCAFWCMCDLLSLLVNKKKFYYSEPSKINDESLEAEPVLVNPII